MAPSTSAVHLSPPRYELASDTRDTRLPVELHTDQVETQASSDVKKETAGEKKDIYSATY